MGQRLRTRSFRNHRDDHRPRLVAIEAADASSAAEAEAIHALADTELADTELADTELAEVVMLHPSRSPHPQHAQAPIRVLVAEEQALVRAGYRVLLESDERIRVVGEASSAEEVVDRANETHPDVVLLDPGLRGLADARAAALLLAHPALAGVAVMLMASTESDERVRAGLLAGAVGVLDRDAEPAELVRAVQVVAGGQALLPALVARQILSELSAASQHEVPAPRQLDELTAREREIVALVAKGLSNDEIAADLVISPATAKTHVSRAMLKIGATHRAQLVVLAYESGLVRPRPQAEDQFAAAQPTLHR
jgi:DNA-binding NarL/FixJ family response regulator